MNRCAVMSVRPNSLCNYGSYLPMFEPLLYDDQMLADAQDVFGGQRVRQLADRLPL